MDDRRRQWAERVAGWRRSGLTAKQFAASIGVNAGTLAYWACRLGREPRGVRKGASSAGRAGAALVEVITGMVRDDRFELTLSNGRRLHVPTSFDAPALERLLGVLEGAR
jgi:transposase